MLPVFQYQGSSPFSQNKSVPVDIKRPGCRFRRIVPFGQCLDRIEPSNTAGIDRRFRAPSHHHISAAELDLVAGGLNGMGGGCACRNRRVIHSLKPVADGNQTGRHIGNDPDNKKRTVAGFPSAVRVTHNFFFHGRKPADPAGPNHPKTFGIRYFSFQAGIFHGFIRSSYRKLAVKVHLPGFFFIHEIEGIKILHFACKPGFLFSGIKPGNRRRAAFACTKILPEIRNIVSIGEIFVQVRVQVEVANRDLLLVGELVGALAEQCVPALIEMGETRVICTASIDERVPMFKRGRTQQMARFEALLEAARALAAHPLIAEYEQALAALHEL